VATYREQSLSSGTEAAALAFIQIKTGAGKTVWGAGVDTNIELASIKAVLSAVNRAVCNSSKKTFGSRRSACGHCRG
jgi:2-isopropylmalate synthase